VVGLVKVMYVPATLTVLTRNRDFRRLFGAELVMFGGDWFVLIPLLTLLPTLTGSGVWGGLVLSADTGVLALLLPFTGTVADRLDRRRIMLLANLAGIGAVTTLLLVRSANTAWLAVLAVAALAAAKAFYTPAVSAALPNLVDERDLAAANALAGSAWGTMLVVGASLGGVLAAAVGPYTCFVVTAACLAVSAVLVWRIRRPMQADLTDAADPPRTVAAIAEAMRYIRHRPRVAALVTVKSAIGLGNGVLTAFPLLATVIFKVGPTGTGLLFAARGAGALLGPLLLRRVLTYRDWLFTGLAISMASYGVAYLGVSLSPWFALVLVFVTVAHIGGGGNWAMSNFALQAEVPDALRGRVFATDMMLATLAISVSQLVIGGMVDHVDTRLLIGSCGAVTMLYAVGWRLATRRLLSRRGAADAPEEAVPDAAVPDAAVPDANVTDMPGAGSQAAGPDGAGPRAGRGPVRDAVGPGA
jgi:MFS family permease